MTPGQAKALAVAMDGLSEAGFDEASLARMKRAMDGELERLLIAWAERVEQRPWIDHACVDCVPKTSFYPLRSTTGWRCLYHRAVALRALLSPAEKPTGASTPQPPGETA
jgi:hypothetical protein